MVARPPRASCVSWATGSLRCMGSTNTTLCSTAIPRPSCSMLTEARWTFAPVSLRPTAPGSRRRTRFVISNSCARAVSASWEYMRWQLDELRQADPKPGEDEALAAERAAMRHAARLAELGQRAMDALHEDGLARAAAAMSLAAALDSRLAEQASHLDGLAEEMSDVAASARRYVELLDSDPKIGRASCRERVEDPVVAVALTR